MRPKPLFCRSKDNLMYNLTRSSSIRIVLVTIRLALFPFFFSSSLCRRLIFFAGTKTIYATNEQIRMTGHRLDCTASIILLVRFTAARVSRQTQKYIHTIDVVYRFSFFVSIISTALSFPSTLNKIVVNTGFVLKNNAVDFILNNYSS